MNTLAGLLDACRTEPDNPTHFLVLGDWLLDQDAPSMQARGEFVHLQCRLAGASRSDVELAEEWQLHDQLLRQHRAEWLGGLAGLRASLVRGMIRLELLGEDVAQLADGLPVGWDWVAEVSLSLGSFTAQTVRRLAEWPGLGRIVSLGLDNTGCTDQDVALLRELPEMPGLLRVSLYNNLIWAAGARSLAESPCLDRVRVLNLGRNVIGPAGARALAGAMYLRGLEELDLRLNGIVEEGALALYRSPLRHQLRRINLVSNGILRADVRKLWEEAGLKVDL
jgi:uncharacterized protein (TIGR02996 family)